MSFDAIHHRYAMLFPELPGDRLVDDQRHQPVKFVYLLYIQLKHETIEINRGFRVVVIAPKDGLNEMAG